MATQLSLDLPNPPAVSARSEPRVWIKELSVLREFKPGKEFRHVSLQPGLNIVWAQDSKSGASGHAAGKSTFCRMLRYLLGDGSFGPETFRSALRDKFPHACLAGEVRLEGEPWLVFRSLGTSGRHWCCRGQTCENVFSEDLRHGDFSEFVAALKAAFIAPLASEVFPGTENPIEWAHLLQWLCRDQDARFSHLLEWRPAGGETHDLRNPSHGEKTNLIRMVLGMLKEPEQILQKAHAVLLSEQTALEGEIPKKNYALDRELTALVAHMPRIREAEKEDVSSLLEEEDHRLSQEEARLKEEFDRANRHDGVGEVLTRTLEMESKRVAELAASDERQDRHLKLLRLRLRHQKKELSTEELRRQSAELGDILGKCSASLEYAQAVNCPLAPSLDRDELQAERIVQARSSSEHLVEQIERDEREHKATAKQLEEARKSETRTKATCTERGEAHIKFRLKLTADQVTLKNLRATISRAKILSEEIGTGRARQKDLKTAIATSNRNLAAQRKDAASQLTKLRDHYNAVASVLLDTPVDGKVEFHSEKIEPTLNYEGDMSSAALVTLRLLIFDLACLIGGTSSFPLHPGLLLHDSPREADLSASIYRRIFTLIAEAPEAPAIQYIIATTEPPPDHLQQEPWLLCPPLSSATADSRFLRVTV